MSRDFNSVVVPSLILPLLWNSGCLNVRDPIIVAFKHENVCEKVEVTTLECHYREIATSTTSHLAFSSHAHASSMGVITVRSPYLID